MKKIIEFIIFNNSIDRAMRRIPNIRLYKKHLIHEWSYISEASLNGTPAKIKEILPLKSFKITAVVGTTVYIKFNKNEFNKVMKSKINQNITELIDEYHNQKMKSKYQFYLDNRDTLELLLDAINEDYHIEHECEIAQLIIYLRNELNYSETCKKQDKNIKQRMELELEFIKRRNEAQNFDFS